MKPVSTKVKANIAPIVVALPNTTDDKMRAIVSLSQAVAELARAVASVNTNVTISNCTIVGAETGISLEAGH